LQDEGREAGTEKRESADERQGAKIEGLQRAGTKQWGSWLSPIELARDHASERKKAPRGRASNRGCLAMSQRDYLKLLAWSARQLRHGRRGRIPPGLPPILTRLGVTEAGWLALVKDFGRLFHRAAGSLASLAREAARRDQAWLHSSRTSRNLFTGSA